jgi:hypothetical protein
MWEGGLWDHFINRRASLLFSDQPKSAFHSLEHKYAADGSNAVNKAQGEDSV